MANDNQQKIDAFGKQVQRRFEVIAANKTLRFIEGNFRSQGYQGATFIRWALRKANSKKDAGRSILVKTGKLRRGWRSKVIAAGELKVFNDIPYAEIHNNGGAIHQASRSETFMRNRYKKGINKGKFKRGVTKETQGFTFKQRSINMPRRQMVPTDDSDSPVLRASIERELLPDLYQLAKMML